MHVERLPDGTRRVTAITEVMRTEGEVITTGDLFTFQVDDVGDDGTVSGGLRWTGLRPTFVAKLERHGLAPDDAFETLRRHARNERQSVARLASAVVTGVPLPAPTG